MEKQRIYNDQPNNVQKAPVDELQIYFNDAYMKERERFNSIFGVVSPTQEDAPDIEKPAVEQVIVEPSPDEYVPVKKFKKVKRAAVVFGIIALFGVGFAIYFALAHFGII